MSAANGSPAFPFAFKSNSGDSVVNEGMSLLDYFAGQALNGVLSDDHPFNYKWYDHYGVVRYTMTETKPTDGGPWTLDATPNELLCRHVYDIAEQMLIERKKRE